MIRSLALSVLLLAAAASPAAAARAGRSELRLSYMADSGHAAAVVLRCDPAGGPHPKKGKACQALGKVQGDPARLRAKNLMCTLEYAPITATVEGTWRGRQVTWSHVFGNGCDLGRTMGAVMAF